MSSSREPRATPGASKPPAGLTVTVDNTDPVTAASAAGYVFGSLTATSPVSVTLSASDGAGSGVAAGSPKYCVDTANTCTPNLAYSAAINVTCAPGSTCIQYVRYHSLDRAAIARSYKAPWSNRMFWTCRRR